MQPTRTTGSVWCLQHVPSVSAAGEAEEEEQWDEGPRGAGG